MHVLLEVCMPAFPALTPISDTFRFSRFQQTNLSSSKWKARNVFLICTAILVLDGGLQGLLVWLLRKAYYEKNLEWPLTLIGALAFILLISGYIPIPFELIKRRGRVVGIDFLFLIIDWFGAFFSLMSLGKFAHFGSH